MSEADLAELSREQLVALVLQLAARVDALGAQLDERQRRSKRQAAPFSKGTRSASPKRPGRKPGQGQFRRREAPAPEQLTEPPVDVPVAEAACPRCGGELAQERVDDASMVDLPEVVRPRARTFRVAVCRCRRCGVAVRGSHPELAPDQRGATAHRLGPRLLAAAHHLHYGLGVPVRKLPAVLELLAGVRLTQGAITHDALRRAEGAIGAEYEALRAGVHEAPYVHTDDTGWRVGGEAAWLMTFETDTATVYQVRPRHRNEEVREVVPADYRGVLVADRGTTYDAAELSAVKQQKCLAHVLRSLSGVLAKKSGKARWFAAKPKALLQEALALWRENRAGPARGFAGRARRLKATIAAHLRDRRLKDPDNQRLLDGLGRCSDAGSVVRFLDEPSVEPTNNRAERALRPAVIARPGRSGTRRDNGSSGGGTRR